MSTEPRSAEDEVDTETASDPARHSRYPTTVADLSFKTTQSRDVDHSQSIYKTIDALHKATLSIPNRIASVLHDAAYVESFWNELNDKTALHGGPWPLIPNERSGSWPLDPGLKQVSQKIYVDNTSPVSAYFKSTDGHINQWAFSTRRLNLPVLQLLGRSGGAVLIDTTRRGKSFPDALRRTVPIWCAVWNQILFPDSKHSSFQGFRMSRSEVDQIKSRIARFIEDLRSVALDLPSLRNQLKRPIRCVWVNQPSVEFDILDVDTEATIAELQRHQVNILVCLSASKEVMGTEMSDGGYIQGAGDDSEGWSRGLTAGIFWQNKAQFISAMSVTDDLESLIDELVLSSKTSTIESEPVLIKPTNNMFLAAGRPAFEGFELCILCNTVPSEDVPNGLMQLSCRDGKLGSKQLREKLHAVKHYVQETLEKRPETQMLICCSTGRDLSVGVALALLCWFYNTRGDIDLKPATIADKQLVKQRLAWITSSKPDANPSRSTMQAVNSVLMPP